MTLDMSENKIVGVMECIIRCDLGKEQKKVRDILDAFDITYDEYRIISNLTMPAIRLVSDLKKLQYKYGKLKTRSKLTKNEIAEIEAEGDDWA